ncbi:hypothetical protein Thermus72351_23700 [Thermus brockianus]
MSERTVGRILAYLGHGQSPYLGGSGRVESVASFLARRGRGRPRRPYAHRKPRGYEAQAPGDLVQVDTLMVTLRPGEVLRHFSAVDLPGAPTSTGTWSGCNGLLGLLCPQGKHV